MGIETKKVLLGSKILCVDDSPDALYLLSTTLQRHGAEVTTCASAELAIDMLKSHRFHVVLSDLNMTGLDGYDLAHALREMEAKDLKREETPTVLVSGDANKPSSKKRFADFQVYVSKPFDQKNLVHIVERLVEADSAAVAHGSLENWEKGFDNDGTG